jgi:CheY-like chemotaxis protein
VVDEQTLAATKAVLVVDDDQMVLNYLSRVIARFGYPVVVASSAKDALGALASDENIGFVLTDIDMPEMTGIELRSEILKHECWSRIPVALMTGGVGVGIPNGVLVLLKPFDPMQIKCTMATHLGGISPPGKSV